MTRQEKLNVYLAKVLRRRLRPGSHDCALFVAGWVKALTGDDHAQEWRGKYSSLSGGKKMLAEAGFDDHIALAASILKEVPPARAQTGDLAVIGEDIFGIFASDRVFVLRSDGLAHVSRMQAKRAFTV